MSSPKNIYPDQRFTRLRHDQAEQDHVTTTFVGVHPRATLNIEGHSLIKAVAQSDTTRAQLLRDRMRELIAHDHVVMTWLEADPANVTLFAHDPVAALRQAIPGLPADFFEGWGTLAPPPRP